MASMERNQAPVSAERKDCRPSHPVEFELESKRRQHAQRPQYPATRSTLRDREQDGGAPIIPFPQVRDHDDDWGTLMAIATLRVVAAYEAIENVEITSLPAVARGPFDLVCRSIFTTLLCLDEFGAAAWAEVDLASPPTSGSPLADRAPALRLLRELSLGVDGNGQP
jgi:hypothetical protein